MLRGYAIGMGAGTQVLTLMAGALIVSPPSELSRAVLMGAGWVINLTVAEWIIRKRPARVPASAERFESLAERLRSKPGRADTASAVVSHLQS